MTHKLHTKLLSIHSPETVLAVLGLVKQNKRTSAQSGLWEGHVTRVSFLVFGQVVMANERLPAFLTLVALVIVVHPEMEPEEGAL